MAGSSRIDELRKKFDENPRRYFAPLANEYRKLGDFEQAIFICQEFLPQQPGHMSGHIVYGQALFEGGRHDEARTVFETALTLDPENLIALRHLGDIARASGDSVSARGWYQRVLEADPRNDEIAQLLQTLGGVAPILASQNSAVPSASEARPDSGTSLGSAMPGIEETATGAPAKSTVSDFAALIEEVRAEAAAEAPVAPIATPPASAPINTEPKPLEGLEGAIFTEVPQTPSAGKRDESELDALFDFKSTANTDHSIEKTADPTSDLKGMATSPEPLADLARGSVPAPAAGAFVTETMAELYLRQGHREQALDVYRQLVELRPDDSALRARLNELELQDRAAVVEDRLTAVFSSGASEPPVTPVEATRSEMPAPRSEPRETRSGQTIRDFLSDIASRRARASESPSSDAAVTSPGTSTAEWPLLTDDREPNAASSKAPDRTSPGLPDLSAEAFGSAGERGAASIGRGNPEASARDAASSVGGSLSALFADAEALGAIDTSGEGSVHSRDTNSRGRDASPRNANPVDEQSSLPGRPTQPAATELSLDYVFRHITPATASPGQPNFSFDQFFSQEAHQDASTSGGEASRESSTDDRDDIQQFNAWLEGLKKS